MDETQSKQAARAILAAWEGHALIEALPAACRPVSIEDGYAVQDALAEAAGAAVVGWKIAATSAAGQAHIGVDGPLAGRILASKLHESGAALPAAHLHMRVAEVEFAFRLARDLPARDADYAVDEVLAAVESLHPAIEIPDSRYHDFAVVGAAQLIADNACTEYLVIGPAAPEAWREMDLVSHEAALTINDGHAADGTGANVLGDPRVALTWLANDRARRGPPLRAGDIVTTGTCITPAPVQPGDRLTASLGPLGAVSLTLVT